MAKWVFIVLLLAVLFIVRPVESYSPLFITDPSDLKTLQAAQTDVPEDVLQALLALHQVRVELRPVETVYASLDRLLAKHGSFRRWRLEPDTHALTALPTLAGLPVQMDNVDLIYVPTGRLVRLAAVELFSVNDRELGMKVSLHAPLRPVDVVSPSNLYDDDLLAFRNPMLLMDPYPTGFTEMHITEDMAKRFMDTIKEA